MLFAELLWRECQGVLGVIASEVEQDSAALARLVGVAVRQAPPRNTGRACRVG